MGKNTLKYKKNANSRKKGIFSSKKHFIVKNPLKISFREKNSAKVWPNMVYVITKIQRQIS